MTIATLRITLDKVGKNHAKISEYMRAISLEKCKRTFKKFISLVCKDSKENELQIDAKNKRTVHILRFYQRDKIYL